MTTTARSVVVLVMLLTLIISNRAIIADSLRLHYYVVYDPIENSGILVVNATISAPDCDFILIPLTIIGENVEFTFVNYTYEGDLLVDGVSYNETGGYVEALLCGNGVLSLLLGVSNFFEEQGVLSYSALVDTSVLEEVGTPVTIEISLLGEYSVVVERVGNIEVYVDEVKGLVGLSGYGLALISLYSTLEEILPTTSTPALTSPTSPLSLTTLTSTIPTTISETPITTTLTTPQVEPQVETKPTLVPIEVIVGILLVFIIVLALMLLTLTKRKR